MKDRTSEKREDDPIAKYSDDVLSVHLVCSKTENAPVLRREVENDVGEREQPRDFDDRCDHVGGDGMISDNRNEMEVVTRKCQKSCKSYTSEYQRCGVHIIGQEVEGVRARVFGGAFTS